MSVQAISPARLNELFRDGGVELIDVRTPAEFREAHVEAARNIPLDRLDPAAVLASRNGSKDATIYLICHAGSRGRLACEKFLAAGFPNVVNIDVGTSACVAAGFIGLELVENFVARGVETTVVELKDQVLPSFDKEMTTPILDRAPVARR